MRSVARNSRARRTLGRSIRLAQRPPPGPRPRTRRHRPAREVVTLRQVRRRRQIRDAGTRIELSLDEVEVIARDREVGRFAELEAELRRGAEGRLAELAAIFDADPALAAGRDQQARDGAGGGSGRGSPATAEDEVVAEPG